MNISITMGTREITITDHGHDCQTRITDTATGSESIRETLHQTPLQAHLSAVDALVRLLAQEHAKTSPALSQSQIHRGIVDYLVDRQPPVSRVVPGPRE